MRLLRLLLREAPGATLAAVAAGLLSGAANAVLLALVNERLTGRAAAGASLLVAFVFLVLLAPLARVLSSHLMVRLSQKAVHGLRMDLSRRILAAPLRRLEEVGPHRLRAAIHEDIGLLSAALANVPMLCIHSAIVVGLLVYLGSISAATLGMLLVFALVGVVVYRVAAASAVRFQRLARDNADALHDGYEGVIRGTKELKLHGGRRGAFLDRLETLGQRLQRLNVAAATVYSTGAAWTQALVFVALGAALLLTPWLPLDPSPQALTTYTVVLLYLLTPLQVIVNTVPDLANAEVAHRKTRELGLGLLDGEAVVDGEPVDAAPRRGAGSGSAAGVGWSRLDLVAVRHRYRGATERETFTLGPLDLTLRPGELVFVIGGNGSGKTTLAKVLTGLYAPQGGEIRLDGEVVSEGWREEYRQLFSAVFSDFYLFDSLLGLDGEDLDQRARRQLETIQLADRVTVEEGRLSTVALSQGQRKRLALLTACLEERPLLVFDEWAADQDPLFRDFFYRRLLPDLRDQGKTVVVITHDDRYFDVADHTLKLEYGQLVADVSGAEAPPRSVFPQAGGGA